MVLALNLTCQSQKLGCVKTGLACIDVRRGIQGNVRRAYLHANDVRHVAFYYCFRFSIKCVFRCTVMLRQYRQTLAKSLTVMTHAYACVVGVNNLFNQPVPPSAESLPARLDRECVGHMKMISW